MSSHGGEAKKPGIFKRAWEKWNTFQDYGDMISPFMGIGMGAIKATQTLCKARKSIEGLEESITKAKESLDDLKDNEEVLKENHKEIMSRRLSAISEAQSTVLTLQEDFKEKKRILLLICISVLCIIASLLFAKRLGFLKAKTIINLFLF